MSTVLVRKNYEKKYEVGDDLLSLVTFKSKFYYYKMVVSIVGIWTKWDFMCSWPSWLIEYNQH